MEELKKSMEGLKKSMEELRASLIAPKWIIGIVGAFVMAACAVLIFEYFNQVGRSLAQTLSTYEQLSPPVDESD